MIMRSILEASKKKPPPAATKLRFDRFEEGLAAQVLPRGPYSAGGPSIERLHVFIEETGHRPRGRNYEIYLNDPSRSDPAKLRTIVRQPIASNP